MFVFDTLIVSVIGFSVSRVLLGRLVREDLQLQMEFCSCLLWAEVSSRCYARGGIASKRFSIDEDYRYFFV